LEPSYPWHMQHQHQEGMMAILLHKSYSIKIKMAGPKVSSCSPFWLWKQGQMWGSATMLQQVTNDCGPFDKIHTASCIYVWVLSLCHLFPLLFTQRITNEDFKKDSYFFSCNSSHNFTPKRNELRYHCCLSQLHFIGH
jgi:hypothetical protein